MRRDISGMATDPVIRTADIALRVTDAATGKERDVYRCNVCKALLLGEDDARDHLLWHDTLVHAPSR